MHIRIRRDLHDRARDAATAETRREPAALGSENARHHTADCAHTHTLVAACPAPLPAHVMSLRESVYVRQTGFR